jgi:two-component system, cell cycle response regulator
LDSLALWRRDSLRVGPAGKILVVEDRDKPYERILEALKDDFDLVRKPDPASAARRVPDGDFDLLIISLNLAHADGLRLCAQVRSLDRIRHLPILIVDESGHDRRWLRGLDMGVNDYIVCPIDGNELPARVPPR